MTQSFDIDKYNSRECEVHNHAFYLGAQSKQAEIDELRKRIDKTIHAIESNRGVITTKKLVNILKGEKDEQ